MIDLEKLDKIPKELVKINITLTDHSKRLDGIGDRMDWNNLLTQFK